MRDHYEWRLLSARLPRQLGCPVRSKYSKHSNRSSNITKLLMKRYANTMRIRWKSMRFWKRVWTPQGVSSNSIELKSLPWCRDFKVFFRTCDQCSQLTLILLDCIIITHGSHDNLHFIPHVSLHRGSLVNSHHLYTLPDTLCTNCSFQFWQDFPLNDQNMALCSCIPFIIYHFECMAPCPVRSCTLFKYCNAGT